MVAEGKVFYSKILLFGEYSIIKSSNALAMPYKLFEGELKFKEVKADREAIKLYNKIVKANSFKKSKSASKYVKDLETLLPFAQEQGLVPKVNAKGVKMDTASKYFQHAYKTKREPISKLFK